MPKFVRLLFLCCCLGLLNLLRGSAAYAGTITGMVGVGTWNTQADFADIKVTQGANTLYQSNFARGASEWKILSGTWQTANSVLHQSGGDTPALALVGDPNWSNYTLTLKARKTGGAEGFLVSFGSPGDSTATWWNIGGWGNTQDLIQSPGVRVPFAGRALQTGVWYDIRIEVQGADVRCYLNGSPVYDTTRILDNGERQDRFQTLLNSSGFNLLNSAEQQWLRDLSGRSVYLGEAARATFDAMPSSGTFNALTAQQQAVIIRKVNRNRMTWNRSWGFGNDGWRDWMITTSMDNAVIFHNQIGLYDTHVYAANSPGTPTADASFNGEIRFGGSLNTRVAIHEISHYLGTGTYWAWGNLMQGGQWTGFYTNTQLSAFDGLGSVLHGDGAHYWPYGENYDNESSPVNDYRHALIVHALRRDMGISTLDVSGSPGIANGTYILVPRHVDSSALEVNDGVGARSATIGIYRYTGAANQKFLLDLQEDGSYRIRTALSGNRCIDLPSGDPANGNKLQLWDDNSNDAQRWYIIPTGDGWFRIAPKNNLYKGMDVDGGPNATADGTAVQSWDYWDGLSQQWRLLSVNDFYTTQVPNGTYVLTPQNSQGSVLEIPNGNAANGVQLAIHSYTGTDNQKFLLDLQSDGSYRIRTALTGNRSMDLPNNFTTNGNKIQLWDDWGGMPQRWYLIPVGNGWYRIGARNNIDMGLDIAGGPGATADGTPLILWDYLAGSNQLWKLTPAQNITPRILALTPNQAVAGSGSVAVTIMGVNFIPASQVKWNGTTLLATTYVSPTRLLATVPASLIAAPTNATLTVANLGGGISSPAAFTVVGAPRLVLTSAVATRLADRRISVAFTIANQGGAASSVTVTMARLAGVASIASPSLGPAALPNGGTLSGTVIFSANMLAGSRALQLYGAMSGASYSLTKSINVP